MFISNDMMDSFAKAKVAMYSILFAYSACAASGQQLRPETIAIKNACNDTPLDRLRPLLEPTLRTRGPCHLRLGH